MSEDARRTEACDDIMTTFGIAMATYADQFERLAVVIGRAAPEQLAGLGAALETGDIEAVIETLAPADGGR